MFALLRGLVLQICLSFGLVYCFWFLIPSRLELFPFFLFFAVRSPVPLNSKSYGYSVDRAPLLVNTVILALRSKSHFLGYLLVLGLPFLVRS
ncbi:hypothetical protein K458DRAFT_94727 [Lentithecium fluviatile CBS 122367]|uniref:Uncharacterized protein n=1 Tax=Lentithecium fluviatile CBS 122367 TaxID=1168545 RepID=A0A6G1IQZ9_9PLEO|nr:hypothetical protein K458DRAFT_94727 [Lentithecium fluviatile CBS 122367]